MMVNASILLTAVIAVNVSVSAACCSGNLQHLGAFVQCVLAPASRVGAMGVLVLHLFIAFEALPNYIETSVNSGRSFTTI